MISLSTFCIFSTSVFADFQNSVEVRAGAFFHSSSRFREIYDNVGVSYGAESNMKLSYPFDAWSNFDWYSKNGKSIGFDDSTKIQIANISFGIKYPFQLAYNITPYLGIGPSISGVWLKNKSDCVTENKARLAFGVVLKTGVYYQFSDYLYINLFADYLYQPVDFQKSIDIGGLKTGIGLGMQY